MNTISFYEKEKENFHNAVFSFENKLALDEIYIIVNFQINNGPSFSDRHTLQKVQKIIDECRDKTSGPIVRHVPADDTEGGAI